MLSLEEPFSLGADFTAMTSFPTVKCEGTNGAQDSMILSSLFSGPSNSYSFMLAPQAYRARVFGTVHRV